MNELKVAVYEGYTNTRRSIDLLENATVIGYSTMFPAGLYAAADIIIPTPGSNSVFWLGGDRVVIRNGQEIVWEGALARAEFAIYQGADAIRLDCVGYWGWLLGNRKIDRRWDDNRMSQEVWKVDTSATATAIDDAVMKRHDSFTSAELHIETGTENWAADAIAAFEYQMPYGETIGRVSGSAEMTEGAPQNDWEWRIRNRAAGTYFVRIQATQASTAFDADESGAANRSTFLEFMAVDNYVAAKGSHFHGEATSLHVYRYTAAAMPAVQINAICTDCQASLSEINASTKHIGIPGDPLVISPFFTKGRETWANVLNRAARYGDGVFGEWYIRLIDSEKSETPNGKPVIECAAYPVLTAYDIMIDISDRRDVMAQSYDKIANWITVTYKTADGESQYTVTPDEQSTLKNLSSIATYGTREFNFDAGAIANAATALVIGRKILAARKNPQWTINGQLEVVGEAEAAGGNAIPASSIKAGMRVRIKGFVDVVSPLDSSGAALTFIISATDYDAESDTCRISVGEPDDLAVFMAQTENE